jgi:hypothetical protein
MFLTKKKKNYELKSWYIYIYIYIWNKINRELYTLININPDWSSFSIIITKNYDWSLENLGKGLIVQRKGISTLSMSYLR